MEKKDIAGFFDELAPTWDAGMKINDRLINRILDNADIGEGQDVLDVACGTGVLFPFYLGRGVSHVTGIDISPQMAEIAEDKYTSDPRVRVLFGDAETEEFDRKFDRIVLYNAMPHFPDPAGLIRTLSVSLKPGGRLAIAHSMSREMVNRHHEGVKNVALPLPEAEDLAEFFRPWFDVDVIISDEEMYEISGKLIRPSIDSSGSD